jgi:hypothetical protein
MQVHTRVGPGFLGAAPDEIIDRTSDRLADPLSRRTP